MGTRSVFLVGYDISDKTKRSAVLQQVKDYGIDGQKSAYECWLTSSEITSLHHILADIIEVGDAACIIGITRTYWQNQPKDSPLYAPTPNFLYIG